MPNYRRLYVPGGTYAFVVTLQDRRQDYLVRFIDDFWQSYSLIQKELPFETLAITIMPDHLHTVWRLPEGEDDFSTRWKKIKTGFTKAIKHKIELPPANARGERAIWQKRFWEHLIRDEEDFDAQINYVHFNPVKHGLVKNPEEWPHSTYRKWKAANTNTKTNT